MKTLWLLLCFLQTHAITGSVGYKRSLGSTNLAWYFNCDIAKNPGIAMIYECPIYPNLSFFGGINILLLKQTWQVTFGVMLHYNGAAVAGYNDCASNTDNVVPAKHALNTVYNDCASNTDAVVIGTSVPLPKPSSVPVPPPTYKDCASNTPDKNWVYQRNFSTQTNNKNQMFFVQNNVFQFGNIPAKFAKFFSFELDNQNNIISSLTYYSCYIDITRTPIRYNYKHSHIYSHPHYISEQFSYFHILQTKDTKNLVLQNVKKYGRSHLNDFYLNEDFFAFNTFLKTRLINELWNHTLSIVRKQEERYYDIELHDFIENNIEIEEWIDNNYKNDNDIPAPEVYGTKIFVEFMYKCLAEAWHLKKSLNNSRTSEALKAIIGKHPFDSEENIEKNINESFAFAIKAFVYFTQITLKPIPGLCQDVMGIILNHEFTNGIYQKLINTDILKVNKQMIHWEVSEPVIAIQLLLERVSPQSEFHRFLILNQNKL